MSASLLPECLPAKEKYDACFIRWYTESRLVLSPELFFHDTNLQFYTEFLRGERSEDETCKKLFLEYSHCLKKALDSKGISKMLDEARKNTEDGDLSRRES
ncbi:TP53 regulated inhibitor of apoptosis 1 [Orbilia oligospora]|nr:TP53 regulated inhibitor of apoptosis 1 [Orbilia oligospora]